MPTAATSRSGGERLKNQITEAAGALKNISNNLTQVNNNPGQYPAATKNQLEEEQKFYRGQIDALTKQQQEIITQRNAFIGTLGACVPKQ